MMTIMITMMDPVRFSQNCDKVPDSGAMGIPDCCGFVTKSW